MHFLSVFLLVVVVLVGLVIGNVEKLENWKISPSITKHVNSNNVVITESSKILKLPFTKQRHHFELPLRNWTTTSDSSSTSNFSLLVPTAFSTLDVGLGHKMEIRVCYPASTPSNFHLELVDASSINATNVEATVYLSIFVSPAGVLAPVHRKRETKAVLKIAFDLILEEKFMGIPINSLNLIAVIILCIVLGYPFISYVVVNFILLSSDLDSESVEKKSQ